MVFAIRADNFLSLALQTDLSQLIKHWRQLKLVLWDPVCTYNFYFATEKNGQEKRVKIFFAPVEKGL